MLSREQIRDLKKAKNKHLANTDFFTFNDPRIKGVPATEDQLLEIEEFRLKLKTFMHTEEFDLCTCVDDVDIPVAPSWWKK